MIADAITYLIYALLVATLTQPNAPRLFAAVTFVGVILLHELAFSSLDGLMYYGSAALLDLLIVVITSGINPVPKMVLSLQRLCLFSILLNLLGWVLWLLYLPPWPYDLAFVAVYAWALYILIRRDRADVGGFTMAGWVSCFRFDRSARAVHFNQHGEKI